MDCITDSGVATFYLAFEYLSLKLYHNSMVAENGGVEQKLPLRITESHPLFLENKRLSEAIPARNAFGRFEIGLIKNVMEDNSVIESLREYHGFIGNTREEAKTFLVQQMRNELECRVTDQESFRYMEALYDEGKEFLGEIINRPLTPEEVNFQNMYELKPRVLDLLNPEMVNDDTFISVIELHQEIYERTAISFKEKVPNLKEGFIKKFIDSPLAEKIDTSLLHDRLDNVDIQLVDALGVELMDAYGDYRLLDGKDIIRIAEQVPEESLYSVFTHEVLHLLSGKSFLAMEGNYERVDIIPQRVGLSFIDVKDKRGLYRWMNEAITETVAQDLTGKEIEIYEEERELQQLLMTQGSVRINERLFYSAYFENYDPSLSPGQRISEWKKLYAAINTAYEPGFLTRLDAFILGNGVTAAIEAMNNDWRAIMSMEASAERNRKRKD